MAFSAEAFELRSTTWDLVRRVCSQSEEEEVRKLLGNSLVEEVQELQNEAELLLDIWRDCRTELIIEEKSGKTLPEPPLVREGLENQIRLFLKLLDENSAGARQKVKRRLSVRQSSVVDYVLREEGDLKRPPSAVSPVDGRETPVRTPSSPLSRPTSSLREDVAEILEAQEGGDGVDRVEHLAEQLSEALLEDKANLESDIALLQASLMNEAEFQLKVETHQTEEPSIKDLRDTSAALEKEALMNSHVLTRSPSKGAEASTGDQRTKATRERSSADGKTVKSRGQLRTVVGAKNLSFEDNHCGQNLSHGQVSKPLKTVLVPTPPRSVRVSDTRKSSPGTAATRFRKMVLDHRNETV